MRDWQCQTNVKHYCRCNLVFMPKYRKKLLFGILRRKIGAIFRDLCRLKGVELVEGYAMKDHIHMLLLIPPKFSVSNVLGFLKGKSAIQIFRKYKHVQRNFSGRHFWARGYCISTVELDEQII
ncbi:IS200/IS605 family transposase [Microbulbifer sp. SSSA008]|uniref:IS200/IS605 family transposase n=1 Tax=Microbulbifer sp. SSSA008 TaxID=3243380 RepID=UPI0040397495